MSPLMFIPITLLVVGLVAFLIWIETIGTPPPPGGWKDRFKN